jgi:hypothetical protein
MSERDTTLDPLAQALRLLIAEARQRLTRAGAVNGRAPGSLELRLRLPLAATAGHLARSREELEQELDEEILSLLRSQALCQPGRAWCRRCQTSTCPHATSTGPQDVFAGYGPTGLPRFRDFGQLLLERRDPRIDALYGEPPGFATLRMDRDELCADLLPAYREEHGQIRLHGQVCAGWYQLPGPGGRPLRLAVTFQILSSGRGRRRRFALHLVGGGAESEALEALDTNGRRLPWRQAVAWAEEALRSIEGASKRRRPPAQARLAGRLDGLLHHFAERLDRPFRSRRRQTAHARERHRSGSRPTRTALGDLFEAPVERVFFDGRHRTWVVLGPRGRTHVFSDRGKLVTSLRHAPATVERRQKNGEWRPAQPAEARQLLERVRSAAGEG